MSRRKSKTRVRLPKRVDVWKPRWEPEIKNWSKAYIAKNKWRCESINGVDDLLQDAYVVFLKVSEAYPRCVEPARFMALYKTSFRNMIFDKSRELERRFYVIDDFEEVNPIKEDRVVDPMSDMGSVAALISQGPPEIRMFMSFIMQDDNLVKLREPQRLHRGEPRMNFDQRVAHLLGIQKFPFRDTLRQLLSTT